MRTGQGTAVDPLRRTLAASKRPCSSKIAEGEPQADSSSTRKQRKKKKKRQRKRSKRKKMILMKKQESDRKLTERRHKTVRLCTGHRPVKL